MNKFLQNLIITLSAFSTIIIFYILADPYSVVWRNDLYYHKNVGVRGIMALDLNKDIHYDSFIFGSSRSENYRIDDWKQYIGETAKAFHSQQSGDNVYGTLARLKYLYTRYGKIKNALFIMDQEYLSGNCLRVGYQSRNHWRVTGFKDFIPFHHDFFCAFFELNNLLEFLGFKEKMFTYPRVYVSEYDENQYVGNDSMLNNGYFPEYYSRYVIPRGDYYWFYQRDTTKEIIQEQVIYEPQIKALNEIKEILVDNQTNYKIIISPLYNQQKFNTLDLKLLLDIFGSENVFDFSGVNEFTNDSTNYYEASHYRPKLCKRIMEIIYK